VVLLLLAGLSACSRPTPAPVLVPGMERYPDYPRPELPPDLARVRQVAEGHDRGWAQLQTGDPRSAERTFRAVLQKSPTFYPSQTALGFTRLALDDASGALDWFDRALARRGDYTTALLGRAEALLALGREGESFAAYQRLLEVEPDQPVAARRVEVLRLRAVQSDVALGRRAMTEGDLPVARAALERAVAASPESGFLHRDLARIARAMGDDTEAIARSTRAIELDANDAEALAIRGLVRADRGDVDAALADLRRAQRLDAALPDVAASITALEARLAEAALPAEFKAIPGHATLTRGDLAALLAHHLPALLVPQRPTALITDARSHWAQAAILQVIRAGVLQEYANHTFQPRAQVTRGDFAVVVNRILGMVGAQAPAAARAWQDARLSFSDVRAGNVLYVPISRTVASGVLTPLDGQLFGARRALTGAEGVDAVRRLVEVVERAGLDTGRHDTTKARP
jgi:tetratricopeptide (TPR) repeat protein